MIIAKVLFALLEVAMILFLLMKMKRRNQITLKDTAVYPFFIVLAAVVIFVIQMRYGEYHQIWELIPLSLSQSVDMVKLSMDTDLAKTLYGEDILLFLNYMFLYLISALCLFSLSLALIKTALKNFFRVRFTRDEVNYIFGLNDDAKTYLQTLKGEQRKNACVVLPRIEGQNHHQEKLYLDRNKIKYYTFSYQTQEQYDRTMSYLLRGKKRRYFVICFFEKDLEIYHWVNWSREYLHKNDLYLGKVEFIVSTSSRQTPFVKELAKGDPRGQRVVNSAGKTVDLKDESRGCIRVFDKYETLAYQFVRKHNFAGYFPEDLINENGTVKDCDVNLYMLGFGKVNQALLKDLLIETQFVTVRDRKLTPLRMSVNIYDTNKKSHNVMLSYGILKYKKRNFRPENYLDLPEDYASHIRCFFDKNVEEEDVINSIYDEMKARGRSKPQVNYFIVSLGSDYENSFLAAKLIDSFAQMGENQTNTYFVRNQNSYCLPGVKERLIYFGNDKEILNYPNVVADDVYRSAKIESCIYEGKEVTAENVRQEWSTLSSVKQGSNLYAIASIPFKLSLMKIRGRNVSEKEYIARYDPANERGSYTYSERLASENASFSVRDVMAFCEHERWNAYELSIGAMPMKLRNAVQTLKDEDGSETVIFKNKSENEIYHLCITSARGLHQYYDFVSALNEQYGLKEEPDVIRYDYDLMDHFSQHTENI